MEQKRIQVSEATIKSINSMLCGNTGVDISVLVEDIANGNGKNQELVKMNVALILNGHCTEFPTTAQCRTKTEHPSMGSGQPGDHYNQKYTLMRLDEIRHHKM